MITFDDVWLFWGEKAVLRGISFSIAQDERVAILGSSGEGKTTILRLIIGLSKPDSGKILIDGKDITLISDEELDSVRLKFSIVFQEGALFDSLTVRDNIAFYLEEHTDMDEDEIDTEVRELLRMVGLEQEMYTFPMQLSGGMQRRVAIARAFAVSEAKVFLYDEPTSGLDPLNAASIRNIIMNLASDGKGFIVVTHEILDALSIAVRFIFLKNGKIIYDGNRDGFLHSTVPEIREFLKPSIDIIHL